MKNRKWLNIVLIMTMIFSFFSPIASAQGSQLASWILDLKDPVYQDGQVTLTWSALLDQTTDKEQETYSVIKNDEEIQVEAKLVSSQINEENQLVVRTYEYIDSNVEKNQKYEYQIKGKVGEKELQSTVKIVSTNDATAETTNEPDAVPNETEKEITVQDSNQSSEEVVQPNEDATTQPDDELVEEDTATQPDQSVEEEITTPVSEEKDSESNSNEAPEKLTPESLQEAELSANAESDEIVTFEDENLEAIIREYLENVDQPITKTEMAEELHYLEIDNRYGDITSLAGLEYAINVESLYIINISATNLDVVGHLQNILDISLIDLEATSYDFLLDLPFLFSVEFSNLNLSDSTVMEQLIAKGVHVYGSGEYEEYIHLSDDSITESSITLSFNYNGPQTVQNFHLYMDGELIAIIDGNEYEYKVSGLQPLTEYSFKIEAVLENEETISDELTLETKDVPTGAPVEFADSNLEQAIKNQLGLDREIYESDMENLTYLYAVNNGIQSLEGIQYAKNLSTLYIYGNEISDISILKELTALESLDISENPIKDFSALSQLTKMRDLDLSYLQINDLSFLKDYNELVSVTLYGQPLLLDNPENQAIITELETRGVDVYYDPNEDYNMYAYTNFVNESAIGISWDYYYQENGYAILPDQLTLTVNGEEKTIDRTSTSTVLDNLQPETDYSIVLKAYENNVLVGRATVNEKTLKLPEGEKVDFEDKNLEQAIKDQFGLERDLQTSDMQNLEHLYLYATEVSSLSGLEGATNLKSLYLGWNEIKDLSPIANLTSLQYLDIGSNPVKDFLPLKSLANLEGLSISQTEVDDTSFINELTNLTDLSIINAGLKEIPDLSNLTKLERLDLRDNEISGSLDLSHLTNLYSLDLSFNNLEEMPNLSGLTKLYNLSLYHNQLSNLNGLANLSNLEFLYVSQNPLTDFSGLNGLTLRELDISNTNITNLDDINSQTELETLHISGNNIDDFSLLTNFPKLTSLFLYDTNITEISVLLDLPQLNMVNLYPNENLDLSKGSENKSVIEQLEEKGVKVYYGQNEGYLYPESTEYGDDEVTVSWSYEGNAEITEFRIYLDGELIDSIDPSQRSYRFQGLTSGGNIPYTVEAWNEDYLVADLYGNLWLPEDLSVYNVYSTTDSLEIYWDYFGNEEVAEYKIYVNQQEVGTTKETYFYIGDLNSLTWYEITIEAVNAEGESITSTTLDTVTSSNGQLYVNDYRITQNSIELFWEYEGVRIDSFQLLIDGNLVDTVGADANSYAFTGLEPETEYGIEIVALMDDELYASTYHYIATDSEPVGEAVSFVDGSLEKAIRDQLHISGRDITTGDMKKITDLYANEYGIKDLSGIEYAVNLDTLYVGYNDITDLSPLANLTNLEYLSLWDNKINDITHLSNLTNLVYLDLDDNQIEDLSPLSELDSLATLFLSGNPITDISVLTELTNLNSVDVYDIDIDFATNEEAKQILQTLKQNGVYVYYKGSEPLLFVEETTSDSVKLYWYSDIPTEEIEKAEIYVNGESYGVIQDLDNPYYMVEDLQANSGYFIELVITDIYGLDYWTVVDAQTDADPEQMVNVQFKAVGSDENVLKNFNYSLEGTEENSQYYRYGHTNEEGLFVEWSGSNPNISIPIGTYAITVFGQGGYESYYEEIEITKDDDGNTIEIVLNEFEDVATDVSFEVSNTEGEPITKVESIYLYSNAVSRMTNYYDGYYYQYQLENGEGTYVIPNVVMGDDYYLEVRADGYKPYILNRATIKEDSAFGITLEQGARVTGTLTTTDGSSLAGASYYIYGQTSYAYGEIDQSGKINIGGLEEENLTLSISFASYQTITKEIRKSDFTDGVVDLGGLQFVQASSIEGTVFKPDLSKAYRASIYLTKEGDRWSSFWAQTDANGNFMIHGMEPGSYTLEVEGYNLPSYEKEIQVSEGLNRVEDILLEYDTSGAFSGEGNSISTAKNSATPGEEVEYRINYQNNSQSPQELTVELNVPELLDFNSQSILVNGNKLGDHQYEDGQIHLGEVGAGKKGNISFKATVSNEAQESIVASATFITESEEVTYSISLSVLFATLQAPEKTASDKIKVYGKAKPGSIVKVYAGETLLAETVAKGNLWYADVKLPVVSQENSVFNLVAKVEDETKSVFSNSVNVSYEPNIPSVKDVTVSAGWNSNIKLNPYAGIVKAAITEFTPMDIDVQFDQEIDEAAIHFLGEKYALENTGDSSYKVYIPGDWSSYGVQLMEISFKKGETEITLPLMEVIVLIDPSGYVFEGSMDKRLPGVTAVVEEYGNSKWIPWDAEFFGQINPQVTDSDGRYGWDVIQGDWRVIFTKEGYESYTSRIVTVPPAETQLNIPLVRSYGPMIKGVTAVSEEQTYNSKAIALDSSFQIKFDRLMDIDQANAGIKLINVSDDSAVSGVVTADKVYNGYKMKAGQPGFYEEDRSKQLAESFTFKPDELLDPETNYKIVIGKDVVDYDEKSLGTEQLFEFMTVKEEPVENEGEEPVENEGEEPVENEGEEPVENEGEEPVENEGEEPVENEGEEPVENEGEEPVENEGEEPVENEGEEPVENEGEEPVENEGEEPVGNEGEEPVKNEGEEPVENEGEEPVGNEGEEPVENEGEEPVKNEGEKQVDNEGKAPVDNKGEKPGNSKGETPTVNNGKTISFPITKGQINGGQNHLKVTLDPLSVEVLLPLDILPKDQGVTLIVTKKSYKGAIGPVLDFTLKREDGSLITDFGKTPVTLKILVNPKNVKDWENVVVYYIGEDGKKPEPAIYPKQYDAEAGYILVDVTHFSTYGVFEIADEGSSKTPSVDKKSKDQDEKSNEQVTRSNDQSDSKKQDSKNKLPNTATNMYMWMLTGLLLVAAGSILMLVKMMRKKA
ncbi:leucine-rich repeat domain-containing protein [Niallia sp. Krafla_26]|uniref:leucine-rich repeat domain-containing protein n=1 Tax=Niallia sp. Krafla_26 TaxID=3064703 RepID=UPI003D17E8C3